MTAGKENPMDTPLKWGPFLLTIVLLIAGQIYTTGVRDTKQAQTDGIVTEMRAEWHAKQDKDTQKEQIEEVRHAHSEEFQASTLAKLSDLVQRVIAIEHSRR